MSTSGISKQDYSFAGRGTMWFQIPHDAGIEEDLILPEDEELNRQNIEWIRALSGAAFVFDRFQIDDTLVMVIVIEHGWPCRSLFCALSMPWRRYGYAAVLSGYYTGYDHPPLGWPPRLLPLRPIWPGFIINTLFYALLLWLLLFAPFAARRMPRRRRAFRGLCEKCAYPIGARPVCTECGAAVARKVEA